MNRFGYNVGTVIEWHGVVGIIVGWFDNCNCTVMIEDGKYGVVYRNWTLYSLYKFKIIG